MSKIIVEQKTYQPLIITVNEADLEIENKGDPGASICVDRAAIPALIKVLQTLIKP